jgi:hypothetical protein
MDKGRPLKFLSTYGWISAIILAILCAIFSEMASTSPFYTVFERAQNSNDDDKQGQDDLCWTQSNTFWPNKQWGISLSHGLCFPQIPDGDATAIGVTFNDVWGTDSFIDVGTFKWYLATFCTYL